MAQFRNITDETLWVATPRGLEKVEPESVLTVDDAWSDTVYFQVGDTGETPLFEAVAASSSKKKTTAPEPAVEPSN